MNGLEKKNQFLREVYLQNIKLLGLHKKLNLELAEGDTLATIMIRKMIEFEGDLGNYFYESMIGSYLVNLFLEELRQQIENLEKVCSESLLKRFVQTLLNRGDLLEYVYICGFTEDATVASFDVDILDFLERYFYYQDDLTEEYQCAVIKNIREELTTFVNEEFASMILEQYEHNLVKRI